MCGFSRFSSKHIEGGLYQSSDSIAVTFSIILLLCLPPCLPFSLSFLWDVALPVGDRVRIIILKLKRVVWTQDWGMNCLTELAAAAASPAARTELLAPFSLSSSPRRLALLCCFVRCSGWLKCLADRPLLKTYPSMASDLWRMRSYTLIQRAAWRGASLYEFCQLQQEGQERKRQAEEERKRGGKKDPLYSFLRILQS